MNFYVKFNKFKKFFYKFSMAFPIENSSPCHTDRALRVECISSLYNSNRISNQMKILAKNY